ncbi:sulfite exporter TauE/SafE family protein [Pedobacter sp.]|uniref:sulfite exporter TauE/SafE family protein n=1 Tax=Pedobacter sp. TaxID=1411316 RepID=UPI003D7F72C6
MEILAYLASVLIGLSLGLVGGGGSILTVPVVVYLFGVNPLLATSYSLFIVGSTSMIGAWQNFKKGLVNVKAAMLFGLSSIVTVFIVRKFVLSLIPPHLFNIGSLEVTSSRLTMLLFALLMVGASYAMIKEKAATSTEQLVKGNNLKLVLLGIAIGLATSFLGAGGGFLLIPALVVLLALPMKEAVGTSLLIITLNSLVGFIGDLGHFDIEWLFLIKVTAMAIAGMFAGLYLNNKIDGAKLKKGFGWFIFIMGIFILLNELWPKN